MADWKKQRVELEALPPPLIAIIVSYSPLDLWDVALESEEARKYLTDPWADGNRPGWGAHNGYLRDRSDYTLLLSNTILKLLADPRAKDDVLACINTDYIYGLTHLGPVFLSFCAFLTSVDISSAEHFGTRLRPGGDDWCIPRWALAGQLFSWSDIGKVFKWLRHAEWCRREASQFTRNSRLKERVREIDDLGIISLLNVEIERLLPWMRDKTMPPGEYEEALLLKDLSRGNRYEIESLVRADRNLIL